jgi:hypothetical protein
MRETGGVTMCMTISIDLLPVVVQVCLSASYFVSLCNPLRHLLPTPFITSPLEPLGWSTWRLLPA